MPMAKSQVKATKLIVGLPFNLGSLEFEPDEVEQQAAWELYVELSTRISTQPIELGEGLIRESLESLHYIFSVTRDILKKAGPSVAKGQNSFGVIAIRVLNEGVRPFLNEWHPKLLDYENRKDTNTSTSAHDQAWEQAAEYKKELIRLQEQIAVYINVLAQIAGIV